MATLLYSHSKGDLEKAVEIILSKATNYIIPQKSKEETPDDLISQKDAAKFLRISSPTIIDWRKNKSLPHYDFNGRFYYSKQELLDYGRRKNHK